MIVCVYVYTSIDKDIDIDKCLHRNMSFDRYINK